MSPARKLARPAILGRGRAPSLVTEGIVATCVLLIALTTLAVRMKGCCQNLLRDLARLEDERRALVAEAVTLEREIGALSSRARISRYAEERLGMRYPLESEVAFVPWEGVAEEDSGAEPGVEESPPLLALGRATGGQIQSRIDIVPNTSP